MNGTTRRSSNIPSSSSSSHINETFIAKPSASVRPRSSIPAPGSLKFGVKKDGKSVTTEQSHLPSASGGQSSSTVIDDRDLKRQSTIAAVVGYGTQSTIRTSSNVVDDDDIHSSSPDDVDNLNQTFTHSKFLLKLIETEYSQAIGRRVVLGGEKYGTLRYFGPLHVAEGLFCGIELEEELGQHDGYIDNRRYFKAMPRHGIFAPVEKVKIVDINQTAKVNKVAVVSPDVASMNGGGGALKSATRLDETFTTGDTFVQSVAGELLDNTDHDAELLDDIEPHLMSYSMLDDDAAVESDGQANSFIKSFELSDSLMFLKQPEFPGVDASMSASQLAAMILSNDGKSTVKNNLTNGKDIYDDEDDIENLYYEEQTTPVCDVNFLQDIESNFAKTATFSSSTPADDVGESGKHQTYGQDFCTHDQDEQKLRASNDEHVNLDDTFSVDDAKTMTKVKLRESTASNSKNVERPISTVSADTGYQGDTEYETQSGRSVSPPEPEDMNGSFEKACDKTIILQKNSSPTSTNGHVLSDTTQIIGGTLDRRTSNTEDHEMNSSTESLVCETIYRDKKGNVIKVVRGPELSASAPKNGLKSSVTIENMKDLVSESKPSAANHQTEKVSTKGETVKKTTSVSPEASPSKNRRLKSETSVGLDSSSARKVLASAKREIEKKPEPEVPKSRKVVKEVEPPPKIVRPPPKPSKHAEIMAKLQQSMAQDKSKPKKDVRSRVFTTSDATKADESSLFVPSRSQSRASSILTSAQISPNEPLACVVDDVGAESKHSPVVDHVGTNGETVNNRVMQKKATVGKTLEQTKVIGKTPLKRENSHDPIRNGLPPAGPVGSKRMPMTKASSLSGSARLTKQLNGNQSLCSSSNSASAAVKTAPATTAPPKEPENLTDKKEDQLKLAKERLIHGAKGFEAMCIMIKHYDEQVIPALYRQLSEIKKELAVAKDNSDVLQREKNEINSEKETLLVNVESLKKENEESLKKAEIHMRKDLEKKLFDLSTEHESEIKKVMDEFRSKEKRLTKGYEKRQNDDALQFQYKITQLKDQHVKDLSDLKCTQAKEIEDLKCQFENFKAILEAKLAESQELCDRYKKEARQLEATLMKDTEKKIQHVNERLTVYQQEIDSLRVVVEMKNGEIHELRQKCQTLEKDLETLPLAKTKIAVLEQKNTELKEALESRKQAERRLSQRHQELQQTCERERDRSVRLSMTNEQLQYRLQHLMMSQSAYETPMSRFPSDDSDADSIIRDKPMSQSLIQIYAGSSPRVSKNVPVTVYTTDGISKALLFDKSDSENSSHQRKRASSERKASSDDSSASPSPVSANRAKSVEKSSASLISSNQRRMSPMRRRNISGTSLVGVPGVETVCELNELRDNCDGQTECSTNKIETDTSGDSSNEAQVRKMCKSTSQGQGCWTDSGIFTSSFHSETADHPLQGTTNVVDHREDVCASLVADDTTTTTTIDSKSNEGSELTPKNE